MQKGKMVAKEVLQIAEKRREVERQRRKGKILTYEGSIPMNSKRR